MLDALRRRVDLDCVLLAGRYSLLDAAAPRGCSSRVRRTWRRRDRSAACSTAACWPIPHRGGRHVRLLARRRRGSSSGRAVRGRLPRARRPAARRRAAVPAGASRRHHGAHRRPLRREIEENAALALPDTAGALGRCSRPKVSRSDARARASASFPGIDPIDQVLDALDGVAAGDHTTMLLRAKPAQGSLGPGDEDRGRGHVRLRGGEQRVPRRCRPALASVGGGWRSSVSPRPRPDFTRFADPTRGAAPRRRGRRSAGPWSTCTATTPRQRRASSSRGSVASRGRAARPRQQAAAAHRVVTLEPARAPQRDVDRPGDRARRRARTGRRRQRHATSSSSPGRAAGSARASTSRTTASSRTSTGSPSAASPSGRCGTTRGSSSRCAGMPQPVLAAINGAAYGGGMCLSLPPSCGSRGSRRSSTPPASSTG